MKARLYIKSGTDSGESHVLGGAEAVIGRADTCDIRIADGLASRQHCVVRHTSDGYVLEDLDSKNGTAVNGVPATTRPLRMGDEIRIGHTVFLFFEDADRERRASPALAIGDPAGGQTILLQRPPAAEPPAGRSSTHLLEPAARARAALTEIGALIRAEPDRATFLEKVLKVLFHVLPVQRGVVLCYEPGSVRVIEEASRTRGSPPEAGPLALGQPILDAVSQWGHSVMARSPDDRPAAAPRPEAPAGATLLAVPLGTPQAVRGVIALQAAAAGPLLHEEDLDLAEAVGAVAGSALETLEQLARVEEERSRLRTAMADEHDLVGASRPMKAVFEQILKAAPTEATVLVRGESGTGKELAARALHNNSPRARRPFLCCNCGAIPEGLAESELFGHEKGAFTGAVAQKKGLFEQAHGGTLFLDEIGELDAKCQVTLLRVIETRTLRRVGGGAEIAVDVRIVAATHRDLAALVKGGRFREDLYYRLHVLEITLPPLRERRDDIPLLADHFLDRLRQHVGRRVTGFEPAALERLKIHPWPGNVRELKNCLERAVILGSGPAITATDIVLPVAGPGEGTAPDVGPRSRDIVSLRELERRAIVDALERCGGNRSAAAERLGIQRSTLYDKMRSYGIHAPGQAAPPA